MELQHSVKWLCAQISVLFLTVGLFVLITRPMATLVPDAAWLIPWATLLFSAWLIIQDILPNLVRTFTEKLVIHDDGIHVTTGILSRYTNDIPYHRIASVEVFQPFLGRIFGYGTVKIQTGNDISGIRFQGIDGPDLIKQLIRERMRSAS